MKDEGSPPSESNIQGFAIFDQMSRCQFSEDGNGDRLINLFFHMVEVRFSRRWPASECLMRGLDTGLFKRSKVDGLIVCANCWEGYDGSYRL